MAPLYDLLSTVAYPDLSPKMAMRIGKRATLAEMEADGWQVFAKEAGIGFPLLRRRITELCERTVELAGNVAERLAHSSTDPTAISDIAELVKDRAKLVSLI
jgi:serine/threonine-protein kinase HipA